MDNFFFYLSEYWFYCLIFLAVIFLVFFFLKKFPSIRSEQNLKICFGLIVATYLVFFSGYLGSVIKPYFTKFDDISHGEYYFHGTGSFINADTVLTNAHVVERCTKVAVRDKNHLYKSKIIALFKNNGIDIALVKTGADKKNFAILTNQDSRIGDIIFYPNYTSKAGVFTKSKGKITAVLDKQLIFLAPKGRKGNSGSPVFNNKGYLIGLLYGGGGFASSEAAATSMAEIKKFANKHNVQVFVAKNQDFDLTKKENFFDDLAVDILCL